MAEYVNTPTETDPDALAQDSFDYLETKMAGWKPSDGQLDTWLIAAIARMIATLNDTLTDVQTSIFRYFGAQVIGLPPQEAVAATANTTWKLEDSLGHTIPQGTAVAITMPGGEKVPFETRATYVVLPGKAETGAGEVQIAALEPGKEGTNLGTAGTKIELLDQFAWVKETGIELTGATAGGQDAEEDGAYLNRLVAELRLQAPRPIIPNDFAELARTIPGVARALAINGYIPEGEKEGNERAVGIAVVDEFGHALSAEVKAEVSKMLLEKREINFIVNVFDPKYTKVKVLYEVKRWPEWNEVDVVSRCTEAITSFLNPANWGLPPFGQASLWYAREKVKINDIIQVLGTVEGVEDVLNVELGEGAGALAKADITLSGKAALPELGEIKGKSI